MKWIGCFSATLARAAGHLTKNNDKGKPVSESRISLTQAMGLTEANVLGNVHGGVIMKRCAMKPGRWPL